VNDVLQLNKIDSAKQLDNHQDIFSVVELLENITSSFEYIKVQNNNQIKSVYSSHLPHLVKGNSTRLSQILMNLIGNACKFTENGTILIKVDATIENSGVTLEFSIEDTGQGIAQNKIRQVFEEFAQGESKNQTYQGTGLGLSIVKKLLHTEGSEIRVESEEGKGSRFSFKMNYEIIQGKASDEASLDKEIKIFDIKELAGLKVLVVEDNKINQMVTRKILEKDQVICDVADNGLIAVERTQNNLFDLILMDVNMPVMDGLEATRAIRKFSDIPIIALTAVELEEMQEKIYSCGMNDIVVKPYDVKNFQQIILKNIQKHKAGSGIY
jgi:CheY-like chemotaxis protein/two-component sensor histidine kinase